MKANPLLSWLRLGAASALVGMAGPVEATERGRRSFAVEIEDAPAGDYSLYVGGSLRVTVSVVPTTRGTRGQVEFESEPGAGRLALDFDPVGQDIAIVRDAVIHFRRIFPAGNYATQARGGTTEGDLHSRPPLPASVTSDDAPFDSWPTSRKLKVSREGSSQ